MKKIFYIIILLFIAGCCPRGLTVVENGPLPASALKFVPYQNDSIYAFQHSDGKIIYFETNRETYEDYQGCADCCVHYRFETNSTTMLSEFSDLKIAIEISNMSTDNLHFGVSIGRYSFYLPTNESQYPYFEICDTLLIDSCSYFDVIKMGSPHGPLRNKDLIKVDSLYYNIDYGIIKIVMSNGDYYKIHSTGSSFNPCPE